MINRFIDRHFSLSAFVTYAACVIGLAFIVGGIVWFLTTKWEAENKAKYEATVVWHQAFRTTPEMIGQTIGACEANGAALSRIKDQFFDFQPLVDAARVHPDSFYRGLTEGRKMQGEEARVTCENGWKSTDYWRKSEEKAARQARERKELDAKLAEVLPDPK